jgi:protoporphyrinogen oxidase
MNNPQPQSVCVIGAGALGLSAAYFLSRSSKVKNDITVTVLEGSDSPGGLAGSHTLVNGESIESYYHHVFKTDRYFIDLCQDLSMSHEICFRPATAGHYYREELYKLGGPADILFGNLLSPISRVRFLAASLYLKFRLEKRFSGLSAIDGSKKFYGSEATKKIWLPLLEGKFNQSCKDVPMSWLASRIRDRSIDLGYCKNGFHRFYERLAATCLTQGVRINYNTKVETVRQQSNSVEINGTAYDLCLSTVGPVIDKSIGINGQGSKIGYLGAICVVYELDSNPNFPYWTNYCDPNSPVLAVINHRELESSERFGDCFPVYTAAYLEPDHKLFNASDNDISALFYEPIDKIAQAIKIKANLACKRATVYRSRYAQPLINPDIGLNPIINCSGPIYTASMHSIYPNDRGQNYAIMLGKMMALSILADMGIK